MGDDAKKEAAMTRRERIRRLSELAAQHQHWERAKHNALTRFNTQAFKAAIAELTRINLAILACGPKKVTRHVQRRP